MAVKVLIIGGSFGGLTTAYELRRRLGPDQVELTLVSRDDRFVFVPSLPEVAMGRRRTAQITFDLAPALARRQVRFAHESLLGVDPGAKTATTDKAEHRYDFLVVATGHRSANEAVEGLGPFDGPGHSLMSAPETEELALAVRRLLVAPGPVVVGAAPGASCIGPAYEFAFELDHLLRRRRLRHAVPITFVTPEPFLGHMGMGGAGAVRRRMEVAFEERDIAYVTSAAVQKVTAEAVEVEGQKPVPSVLSMVIPPLGGVEAIATSSGLANSKGFIPVDGRFRHLSAEGVYAVGVAVAVPPVGETPVPVNFPKTGHMTVQMAKVAAADIAARARGGEGEPAEVGARCIMSMGDRAVYMAVDPVRPPRDKIPTVSEGRRWLVAKQAFERLYLYQASRGRQVPTALGW
jgi:sulfide:quinone oxidoreductase